MNVKLPFHISQRTQKALSAAQEEARKLGSFTVAPEHLLLGLLSEDNIALRVLQYMGIHPQTVDSQLRQQLTPAELQTEAEPPQDARAQRVLELAHEEGRLLNNNYIGTENILLGIVREGQGIANSALSSFGVTLEKVREEVRTLQTP